MNLKLQRFCKQVFFATRLRAQPATLIESCLDQIGAAAEEVIPFPDGAENDRLCEVLASEFCRSFADLFQMLRCEAKTVQVDMLCKIQAI